jgi:hypothetical protein
MRRTESLDDPSTERHSALVFNFCGSFLDVRELMRVDPEIEAGQIR